MNFDSPAETLILNYLNENYKPFAINDIIQNLHNAVSKTNAVRALDNLVNEKRILCKQFGKISIYVRNEIQLEVHDTAELTFEQLQELSEELGKLKSENKDWKHKYESLMDEPTNDELSELIANLKQDTAVVKRNIEKLNRQGSDLPDKEMITWFTDAQKRIDMETKRRKVLLKSCIQLVKHGIQPKDIMEFLVCFISMA